MVVVGPLFYFSIKKLHYQHAADKNEKTKVLSLLGVVANDIKDCIEGAESMVTISKYGSPNAPIGLTPIVLNNYPKLKNKLVVLDVFTAREWSALDQIINEVEIVNEYNNYKDKAFAAISIYRSIEVLDGRLKIVAKKYIEYGGKINDLVMPLRVNNLEQYLPKMRAGIN